MKSGISAGVFRFSETDKSIIEGEIRRRNIESVLFMAVGGLPIALIVAGVFYHGMGSLEGVEYTWRRGVILLLLFLVFICAASGAVAYHLKLRNATGREASAFTYGLSLLLPVVGALITSVDQLVISSINAYLMLCVISALLIPSPRSRHSLALR